MQAATSPLWMPAQTAAFPSLDTVTRADVCVVGLGASGLAAVRALLDRGADVVGLDAGRVGGGASGRNGGFLLAGAPAFHHDAVAILGRQRAVTIYRLTLDELARMAADTPSAVRRTGSLRVAMSPEEEADCAAQLEAMRRDGLPAERYDGPQGHGLLFPADASLQPWLRCAVLAERVRAAGARLHEHSAVTGLGDGQVRTRSGVVRCTRVVVAVDGGLEAVVPELADRVRTARAQMVATAPTDEVAWPRPAYARWGWDYWQQLVDGAVVLGGFRDAGGAAEWTTVAQPSPPVQAALDAFLRHRLGVQAPVTHRWAGLIAFTDDKMPVLAEVRPGVVVAGAYNGTGNVLGTLCARAAVDLALEGRSRLGDQLGGS